jgi:hypothetical protein
VEGLHKLGHITLPFSSSVWRNSNTMNISLSLRQIIFENAVAEARRAAWTYLLTSDEGVRYNWNQCPAKRNAL